jgi:hypothetical protein
MKPDRKFITGAFMLAMLFLLRGSGLAWWNGGHQSATQAALSKAPEDMPAFFRKASVELSEMSTEPDNWKHLTAPNLKRTEAPEHYIDLEYLEGKPIPQSRFELVKYYVTKDIDLSKGGFLPHALQENYERLMLAFREHRNRPDSVSAQQRVLMYAGWLAHYAQDAAMPLHTTINYDGKPGVNGAPSPQKGIHNRIDAYPEKFGITAELMAEGLKAEHAISVWPLIVKTIQESHTHVERCFELEAEGAFEKSPEKGREFILARTRVAAKLTLDLWYSAWLNSDMATIK